VHAPSEKLTATGSCTRGLQVRSIRYDPAAWHKASPLRKFSSSLRIDILLAQHTATGASEKILSSGQGAALSSPGISEK
jgi:hypothetical protein